MNILVTGSSGFIGKNLISELKNRKFENVLEYNRNTSDDLLEKYCKQADFVFNLAGVNRPKENSEFISGNFNFTKKLLETLKKFNNTCPVMLSSSTQAVLNNPYGESKKAGEDLLISYAEETGAKILIYRFPNVFGKWCRPNYNSAIATFNHNIAHGLPIQVNDPTITMNLVYIDDLVNELIGQLEKESDSDGYYCEVPLTYSKSLGEIVELIYSFKETRIDKSIPNMSDSFIKKLYSTYLSYLPKNEFSYDLKMNKDERGSFTEFIKTLDRGQISVNISKAKITKGNHWHHTKNEKFLVVSGEGVIRFRNIHTSEIIEYYVSGNKLQVLDIPVGYTHNIENIGDVDLVTIMWANEAFDSEKPDTYFLEV